MISGILSLVWLLVLVFWIFLSSFLSSPEDSWYLVAGACAGLSKGRPKTGIEERAGTWLGHQSYLLEVWTESVLV